MRRLLTLLTLLMVAAIGQAQLQPIPAGYVNPVAAVAANPTGDFAYMSISALGGLITSGGGNLAKQGLPSGYVLPVAPVAFDVNGQPQYLQVDAQGNLKTSGGVANVDCTGTGHIQKIINGVGTCTADGAGGSTTFQANGVNLSSATTVNYINGTNVAVTNPGGAGNVQFAITGVLAKGSLPAVTVYTDQANTYSAGLQKFLSGANFQLSDPTTPTKLVQFDASNITAATTRTVTIPNANSTTVVASTAPTNQFATAVSALGVVSYAQPDFTNLTGTATSAQLPNSSATIGGVKDIDCTGTGHILKLAAGIFTCSADAGGGGGTSVSVNGSVVSTPNFANAGLFNFTNPSGSLVNVTFANIGANTVLGNNTGSPAAPTAGFINTAQATGNVQGSTTSTVFQVAVPGFTTNDMPSFNSAGSLVDSGFPVPNTGSAVVGQVLAVSQTSPSLAITAEWNGICKNEQSGTSYTVASTDRGCLISHLNGSATAVTLPVAGSAGFDADFHFYVINNGTGTVTYTSTSPITVGTVTGTTIVLPKGWGALVTSENVNVTNTYTALLFPGPASTTLAGLVQLAGNLGGTSTAPTVLKVNDVAYPSSPAVHSVPVITASNVATHKVIPDCQDATGNHLNYTQSGDSFSCGTTSSGGGGGGSSGGGFAQAFTGQTSITIAGTSHNFGTKNIITKCYDTQTPAHAIDFKDNTVDSTTFDDVITFQTAQSGYCVLVAGPGKFSQTFTSQTSLSVPGATHGLGTADLNVTIYDSATGTRNRVQPGSVAINSSTFDVTVLFSTAQSGRIVIQ